MNIALFCHSLISDWNHGNAHFLRGIASELLARGHGLLVFEPWDAWSIQNLIAEHGETPIREFHESFPTLQIVRYDPASLDLDRAMQDVDLAIMHEWNDHDLVRRIGKHRAATNSYHLLFHDTHHRSVTERAGMAAYDLSAYDGVLAFGRVIRDVYLNEGWISRAWIWHEAADTRVFHPYPGEPECGDLIWIGNWGDEERTAELREFLIEPVRAMGLRALVHGVRYPDHARQELAAAGIQFGGWLPNYKAPYVFSRYRVTMHVPRRPYVESLPGVPTIRVFEALACGIPLICAPWSDSEGLFTPGRDYLTARNGPEMQRLLRDVLYDRQLAAELAAHGRRTVLERHTCAHRVDELLRIAQELGVRDRRETHV